MLADPHGELAKGLGVELNNPEVWGHQRSKRCPPRPPPVPQHSHSNILDVRNVHTAIPVLLQARQRV